MKFLTVRFSPASYQFLSLMSKYFPNHHVLENLQVEVPPLMSEAKLHVRTKLQTGLQFCTHSYCKREDSFLDRMVEEIFWN